LYGCETWSLTLGEEHRWVFGNRVLRRIFGSKREKVVEGWKKLHNEELLHNLYTSPNIITVIKSRRMKQEGHVAHMGGMRNAYNILLRKPGGKGSLEADLREIGQEGVDQIHLFQNRDQWRALVYTVMNLWVA
jgi:hypothetical protein